MLEVQTYTKKIMQINHTPLVSEATQHCNSQEPLVDYEWIQVLSRFSIRETMCCVLYSSIIVFIIEQTEMLLK